MILSRLLSRPTRVVGALALHVGLAAATSGCFILDGHSGAPPYPGDPDQVEVDTGAVINVTPGEGAGVFVEYFGDGAWSVTTSCDTDLTNRPCAYDIIIAVAPEITVSSPALVPTSEPVDRLTLRDDGTFRLTAGTASRLGGITFLTDPGAAIEMDMLLDGQAQPWFVFWSQDGELASGDEESSNPIAFTPTLP